MIKRYRLHGTVGGGTWPDGLYDVGVFRGPRIDGEPVAWVRRQSGAFSFSLPQGSYYVHALYGRICQGGFFDVYRWGSYGGLYGFGTPVEVADDSGSLQIVVTDEGRDLLHVPVHQQAPLADVPAAWVREAVQMVQEHPAMSVSEVADRLSINRVYLCAIFKRARGMTIEQFRTCVRIERAKGLLALSEEPLLEVADQVGYESVSQLIRSFAQRVGLTPGQWREQLHRIRQQTQSPPALTQPGPPADRSFLGVLLDWAAATIRGQILYDGAKRGRIIYIGAFRTPSPTSYPLGWTSLPKPGPFTLRCLAAGTMYVMACYCQSPMRYPGDMRTAFADGAFMLEAGAGKASPLHLVRGQTIESLTVRLTDSDKAARQSGPWLEAFLPDGR